MPLKVVHATYEKLEIRAENTWLRGAKLYVNEKLVDTNKQLFSVSELKPILRYQVTEEGKESDIEIYCVAWVFVKLKICVNGVRVGGDEF